MDPTGSTAKRHDMGREELLQRIDEQTDKVRVAVEALQALIKESRKGAQNGAAT